MYSLYSWGTPFEKEELWSFDPQSLSIQAYLQLCKVDWQLHYVKSPGASPSRCLPVLLFKNNVAETGLWRIVRFLQNEGHESGVELDREQLSQTTAYVSMVQDGLVDAILYTWYLVPENFVQVIRPRLAGMFGLPLSLIMPTHLKECATQRLATNGMVGDVASAGDSSSSNGEDNDLSTKGGGFLQSRLLQIRNLAKDGFKRQASGSESIEATLARHPVLRQADKYLLRLSQKLGEKDYFFGTAPSLLDAVVYGHLSLIIRINLPHNTLRMLIVTRYINLVEHCTRVHNQLNPPTIASSQSLVAGIGSYAKQTVSKYAVIPTISLQDIKHGPKTVDSARAVFGAVCTFVGYLIYHMDSSSSPSSSSPSQEVKEQDNGLLGSVTVRDILDSSR